MTFLRPLIAFLSAASLAYEVLLVRLFAIEQFHHFAAMAISVAMLGFGVSGSALAMAGPPPAARIKQWIAGASTAAAVALTAAPLIARTITIDFARLTWDAGQLFPLAAVYLVVATPFAAVSLAILLALHLEFPRPGAVYGASFAGAGIGAVLAVAVLWILPAERAALVPALVAVAGALPVAPRIAHRGVLLASALAAIAGLLGVGPPLQLSPYKGLPQATALPGARRIAEDHSPLGWVTAVSAPSYRYAPGLSLAYRGPLPPQVALFVDGETAGAVSSLGPATTAMLPWLPAALPYALHPRAALVIGSGGGLDVSVALVHGVERVLALELNPVVIRLASTLSPADAPSPYEDPRVTVRLGDARTILTTLPATFDLVSVGPAASRHASTAGVHALAEDFLHTVEAHVEYLERLRAGGTLAVTHWLTVPPRSAVRAILTAGAALRLVRPDAAQDGLVVAHGWGTVTVLVRPDGFGQEAIAAMREWATSRGVDLDWYPGVDTLAVSPITDLGTSDLAAAGAAARSAEESARFAHGYAFAVAPATDARPYPNHFLTPAAAWTMWRAERGTALPFAEWGPVLAVATFVQAVALAGLFILVPAVVRGRRGLSRLRWARIVSYFGLIGLGYLCAEIAALQQLHLLLGHPVYAVSALLAVLLVASGLGALRSDRADEQSGRAVTALLAVALAGCALLMLELVGAARSLAAPVRVLIGVVSIGAVGYAMGMPFALGLRRLTRTEDASAGWAWAANAFASVAAAPLAALIGMELGSGAVFGVAAVSYLGAAALYGAAAPRGSNESGGRPA